MNEKVIYQIRIVRKAQGVYNLVKVVSYNDPNV